MKPCFGVKIDSIGRVTVEIPLSPADCDRYRGQSVPVVFGLVRFDVAIQREITLPLASNSFADAENVASVVADNVLSAVRRMKDPLCDDTFAGAEISLTPGSITRPKTIAAMATEPSSVAEIATAVVASEPVSFTALFDAWAAHHLRCGGAPTTPPYWRLLVNRFVEFVGHDRPDLVTTQDIRSYRDHLIVSGRKLRTARHADFAALRALFHFGIENEFVSIDPTVGVKFRAERLAAGETMSAFSAGEARAILSAADRQTIPARRWIPWLTALTGSRVAAIANLRKQDVIQVDGLWCLRISRQAGPIKTAASERVVPLHSAILDRGFIAFVERTRRERLFFDTPARSSDRDGGSALSASSQVYNPARSTIRRLTDWLHSLELEIGRDVKKDPNHAWRHWFKEQAFAAGIPEKIADAIVGHAQATTSRRYGSVSIAVMARELEKIRPPA